MAKLYVSSEYARYTKPEMLTLALTNGMITLIQDGIRKTLQGFTTYRQVRAVALK